MMPNIFHENEYFFYLASFSEYWLHRRSDISDYARVLAYPYSENVLSIEAYIA